MYVSNIVRDTLLRFVKHQVLGFMRGKGGLSDRSNTKYNTKPFENSIYEGNSLYENNITSPKANPKL